MSKDILETDELQVETDISIPIEKSNVQPTEPVQPVTEQPVEEHKNQPDYDMYPRGTTQATYGDLFNGDLTKEPSIEISRGILPSVTPKEYDKLRPETSEAMVNSKSAEEGLAYYANEAANVYYPNRRDNLDSYQDKLNNGNYSNRIEVDGKQVVIKSLGAKDLLKPDQKPTQSKLLASYMSFIGSGEKTIIPLWHSGFRIVIDPLTITDIYNYHLAVQNELTTLGKDNMGLTYSNENVVLHKLAAALISKNMTSTSLEIDLDNEDIFDYISILDMDAIYLGLLASSSSRGIEISTTCGNTNRVEDGKPKCDYSAVGRIVPSKMLWVDYSRIPKWAQKQVLKTTTNSVTKEEALKYREELAKHLEKNTISVGIDEQTGESIKFNLKIPTISEYLNEGSDWVSTITTEVQEAVSGKDENGERISQSDREARTQLLVNLTKLSIYNAYVDTITVPGSYEVINDRDAIREAMSAVTRVGEQAQKVIEEMVGWIEDNTVAKCAVPGFICPKCQKDNADHDGTKFQELIAIDPLKFFFDGAVRTQRKTL